MSQQTRDALICWLLLLTTPACIYNGTKNGWLAAATLSFSVLLFKLAMLILAELEKMNTAPPRTQEEE